MRTLMILHDEYNAPGLLGSFLDEKKSEVIMARLYAGDKLPDDANDLDLVAVMGGDMNVYQESMFPFIVEEENFLHRAIAGDRPVIGICFGAQMIAKTCGVPVTKAREKEIGWQTISLTAAAGVDPVFHGLPKTLTVFEYHEDTFEIPKGATLLAESSVCPHQAFRYRNSYGLQFHPEIDQEILEEWFRYSKDKNKMMERMSELRSDLLRNVHRIFSNFYKLAQRCGTDHPDNEKKHNGYHAHNGALT